MASTKEIQDRMKSIRDTLKITSAMYMISSAKMKKAKKMLYETEPFFDTLQLEMVRIIQLDPKAKGKFYPRTEIKEEDRKAGYVVITGDKGLAGAYNHNILKSYEEHLAAHPHHRLYCLGEVGYHYMLEKGYTVDRHLKYVGQNPTLSRARLLTEELIGDYLDGTIDELYMVYTRMVNAMTENVVRFKLLPIEKSKYSVDDSSDIIHQGLTFDPGPDKFMEQIVPVYMTGYLFGAFVEADACEHNARMMAMKSSSDNAKEMLSDLEIAYNRARQGAITQEITEVVAGANAQKRQKKS